MKRNEFSEKLYNYMQDRILEIINKFGNGNYNDASYPAFMIGAIGDIEEFLEENDLRIRKSRNVRQKIRNMDKNVSLNLIYWGLHHLVWVIDKLGYDYMTDWRNEMCKWQVEIEKRYNWVGENQRSYGYCDCSEKTKEKRCL